jgi:hypothetical protein
MQALDSFISPIPGFDRDVPILAIPVLTQSPGNEITSDPSAGVGASASRTRAGKRKTTANLTPQKKPRSARGNPWVELKSTNLCAKHLLRLLHWVLGKGSRSINQKGISVSNIFHYHMFGKFIMHEPLRRMPQDINLNSSAKSVPAGSESPNVDKPQSPFGKKNAQGSPKAVKPPSPQAERTALESPKFPCPESAENLPGDGGASSSSTHAAPNQNPMTSPSNQETTESPKVTPPNPQSYGLGSIGGRQPGGDLSAPSSGKSHCIYS